LIEKHAENFFKPKQGWVFNPWLDLLCFYFPILISYFFHFPSLRDILVLKVTFDTGHVFATLVPLYFYNRSADLNLKKLFIRPLAILLALQILCYFNFSLFTYALGYYALFHIGSQLYGWLAKIQRNSIEPVLKFDLLFERIFLISMLLSAILFWHTTYSQMAKGYFYENNLALPVSFQVWKVLDNLFVIMMASWVIRLAINYFKTKKFPMGKFLFLLSVWLMFYWSLVVNHSSEFGFNFFWFSFVLSHGLSYIIHIFIANRSNIKEPKKILPYFAGYLFGIFVTGAVWGLIVLKTNQLDVRYAAILVWGPLILHYVIDGIIWKSSFLKAKV
jgi:hypothetical protein